MKTRTIITTLALIAVITTFGDNKAGAAVSVQVGTPNSSFSFSDYQPPPPNVYVQSDRGRPYYVERDRRVYMEKRQHGKHHKKEKYYQEERHHGGGHNGGHEGHGRNNR